MKKKIHRGSNLTMTEYRSVSDMNSLIVSNLDKFPSDFNIVAGVPRSGLLPANLIALYLNLPLTDIEGLKNDRLINSGHRKLRSSIHNSSKNKVLVVDDCIGRGTQIRILKENLSHLTDKFDISYMVPYVTPGMENLVDIWLERLALRRIFQWNILHSHLIEKSCVDIKILTNSQSKSLSNEEFLSHISDNKPPNTTPTYTIGHLITNIPDKYHAKVATWLGNHDIKFDKLITNRAPGEENSTKNDYIRFKSNYYVNSGAYLSFEWDLESATRLSKLSGKPVFCLSNWQLIKPTTLARASFILKRAPTVIQRKFARR